MGATYKQIYKIGHQVGFNKQQMNLWVGFCSHLPLSQKMASYLVSCLPDRERETEEAKRLIGEALEAEDDVFEAIDNLKDPNNVTYRGDQITPGMAVVLSLLIDLGGKEHFVDKGPIVEKTKNLPDGTVHVTNGLLYQLAKRDYIEEAEVEARAYFSNPGTATRSTSYRLTGEFRRFLEKHDLHALVRQHLRS